MRGTFRHSVRESDECNFRDSARAEQRQRLIASAQSIEYDRHEPGDGGFGPQAAPCSEGVDAVVRELIDWNIGPDYVRIHGLDEQVTNDLGQPLFWSGNVLGSMD